MSMTQLLIPFVALVVAGTGLAQQSRVIPPGLADIEGNLSSTSPFGRTTAGMQFLCDPNVVATAPGFVIDIGLRDEGDQNTYQSYTKQYKLTAAQTSVLAAAMTTDPVVNHGGSTPVVVFQALLNVPGSVPQAVLPKPFALRLPFNAPFKHAFVGFLDAPAQIFRFIAQ